MLSRWKRRREIDTQREEPAAVVTRSSDGPSVEEVYHDAALQFLTVQISTNDVLDSRTFQAFTIGSTVLPLTFALLNLSTQEVPAIASWALGVALGFYVLLLAMASRVSFIRALEYRPNIAELQSHTTRYRSLELGGRSLEGWVADEYLASISENRGVLIIKSRWVGALTAMLFSEGICLAVAALLTLVL